MKYNISFFILAIAIYSVYSQQEDTLRGKCELNLLPPTPTGWVNMMKPCIDKMKEQVEEEFVAAMTYMAMGAHFSRDKINRAGFAKMFFKAASEEREHAMKIMEYLSMRGELVKDFSSLIKNPKPIKTTWLSGHDALTDALNLETRVTKKITQMVQVCEGSSKDDNDYHLVDYLTAEFLDEQLKGQREIAGKVSTLGKMMKNHATLGEYLYDKKLLSEL